MIIQTELDLEKTKSEQLKEAYLEGAKQISHYKKLIEEMEVSSRNALKLENENWQKVFDDLKVLEFSMIYDSGQSRQGNVKETRRT